MGNRIVRIQKDTPWSMLLHEVRVVDSTSICAPPIVVESNGGTTEIPASLFLTRNRLSGMPSKIVVSANGFQNILRPEHFIQFVKIILSVEHAGGNTVLKGVPPQWFDLSWFRGCGFLGREYSGRRSVTIVR